MKVAVSSTGKDLDAQIDPRFGRCAYFVVVNPDDMSFDVFDNENVSLSGGAGIQAASFLSSKKVDAVLTGNCGPNAMKTFDAAGIKIFTGLSGTVGEAVEKYKQGGLTPAFAGNVPEKAGMQQVGTQETGIPPRGVGRCRGGAGRGMGGGGGRGMGGGRCMESGVWPMGAGLGFAGQQRGVGTAPSSKEESLSQLKEQAAQLQRQIEVIQEKIKNIQEK